LIFYLTSIILSWCLLHLDLGSHYPSNSGSTRGQSSHNPTYIPRPILFNQSPWSSSRLLDHRTGEYTPLPRLHPPNSLTMSWVGPLSPISFVDDGAFFNGRMLSVPSQPDLILKNVPIFVPKQRVHARVALSTMVRTCSLVVHPGLASEMSTQSILKRQRCWRKGEQGRRRSTLRL